MKTYWTLKTKPEVLSKLEKMNESKSSDFGKAVLKFEKSVCTCMNRISDGVNWENVIDLNAYYTAYLIIIDFNGSYNKQDSLYWDKWEQYCLLSNTVPTSEVTDWLC